MKTSQEIMNLIYDPATGDDLYQKNRQLYFGLAEKLNASVRTAPSRMVALSAHSQYIFMKRNQTSINKSVQDYCEDLSRTLPANAPRFFPEIQNFLDVLGVNCTPSEFDNAVLVKIDVYSQGIYASRDRRYFELKNFFFKLENCDSPLDLLFRGLFYARARQSHRKLVRVLFTAAAILAIVFLVWYW